MTASDPLVQQSPGIKDWARTLAKKFGEKIAQTEFVIKTPRDLAEGPDRI
jgi:hypothetical protein